MFRLYGFLTLFLSGCLSMFGQGFNVSTTNVELPSESVLMKISIKLSTEELSQALKYKVITSHFEDLSAYVEKRFSLRVNRRPAALRLLGKKVEERFTWVEYESSVESAVSEIKVSNSLLIERYPNQRNIVNFNIKGVRKTVICEKGSEEQQLSF